MKIKTLIGAAVGALGALVGRRRPDRRHAARLGPRMRHIPRSESPRGTSCAILRRTVAPSR